MSKSNSPESNIKVTLTESRAFEPSPEFAKNATYTEAKMEGLRRFGQSDPEGYWSGAALELSWFKPWDVAHKWDAPHAEWFVGGRLNASYNCLDRHLKENAHKAALIWEGEPGEVSSWTYSELHYQVERCTAGLRRMGLKPGDRVAIYMPLVPESVVAMLACARGGFTHTVIFGGFSAESLKDRMNDAGARAIITADYGYRKGAALPLRTQVELALPHCSTVDHVLTLARAGAGSLTSEKSRSFEAVVDPATVPQKKSAGSKKYQEYDWSALLGSVSADERKRMGGPAELESEHPLFILYTSGTTGKPKGLVHSTGGFMTGALRSCKMVFDLKPGDLYWCTADIGWVTGHTYLVYGPLAAGATIFMYEGAPTTPTPDRFWAMIERHRVNILYTAPTAIRAFMKLGVDHPRSRDLSSLRLLGSVGEPINPEAWMWYHENVGHARCPIVDTYWQTETGSIVVSPVPGAMSSKPGSATLPLPGYDVDVVDKAGKSVPAGSGGYLVIKKPWPSMARTIYGDSERFAKAYFSEYPGIYFTGDGARKDEDGYIWCLGRVDDVLNVSGHRLGTMEIESALVAHPKVAEAAVVGRPDELKGQGIVAFVTLKSEFSRAIAANAKTAQAVGEELKAELKKHVVKEIGALARPDDIRFTESLPKTRSGKIMRRLLRELATSGTVQGDTSTLEDLNVIASLQKDEE